MLRHGRSSPTLEEGKPNATLMATCNYFHVFGIDRPLLGRLFTAGDCNRGSTAQVAVLSESTWKNALGGNASVIGQTIHLNGSSFQVIGIVSSDAANFLPGGIFVPYTTEPLLDQGRDSFNSPNAPWLAVAGRLHSEFSRVDAQSELSTILSQQDRAYVKRQVSTFNRRTALVLTNGSFIQNPAIRTRVVALVALILGPLTLILLLACCNVTMLFLSRTVTRRGEIAVRLALGAGRGQLARMLLAESLLIAVFGGAISILLVYRVPLPIMNTIDAHQARNVLMIHPDWQGVLLSCRSRCHGDRYLFADADSRRVEARPADRVEGTRGLRYRTFRHHEWADRRADRPWLCARLRRRDVWPRTQPRHRHESRLRYPPHDRRAPQSRHLCRKPRQRTHLQQHTPITPTRDSRRTIVYLCQP